jgi:tetrapyrrole methylase family protein/MazG family protein
VSRPSVTVVGLGPADAGLVTAASITAIGSGRPVFLRTARHPASTVAPGAETFDEVYESAGSMSEVYGTIVERLVAAATAAGSVVYAVPGSPVVAEHTVELLAADDRVDIEIIPALSFLDLAWARLAVDPVAVGARIVDGHRFAVEAAGERGPLLVGQCDRREVLSGIKLSLDDGPPVTVIQRLGLPDEAIFEVPWDDLDRSFEPDHLTTIWIPHLAAPVAAELVRFAELVRDLRAGCPWDAQQTHESLRRYLLEETYEVLETIDELDEATGDGIDEFCEELGDLLFQVYFHSTIASEEGWFDLADVVRGVHDKLWRRHPHVFGDTEISGPDDVVAMWEANKRVEKRRDSVMDGIPPALPALARAAKVARKAAHSGIDAGFEPGPADPGAELWELVGRMSAAGLEPEDALRETTNRYIRRFRQAESG